MVALNNDKIPADQRVQRFRFAPTDSESAYAMENMKPDIRMYMVEASIVAVRAAVANSDILLWRGDIMDAALSGADALCGLEMPEETLPPRPEIYLHDPHSPPSKVWADLSRLAAGQFGLDGGLSLRAIVVTGTIARDFVRLGNDERLPENIRRVATSRLNGEGAGFLNVSLILRNRNESNDSNRAPYIVDSMHRISQPITAGISLVAAACREFCEQPFVTRGKTPFPKWRRPGIGADRYRHGSIVNTIVLRRPLPASGERDPLESQGKREYSCQWIVSGHWRRLATPRKSDGKMITYVTPHVKGNPDAPLLPRFNVAHVKR